MEVSQRNMIKRVRIKGYNKSLADVEVDLAALTVVIGPNAAGKSNLLDALGLLSRMVTQDTIEAAYKEHRGERLESFYYGDAGLQGLVERESAQFTIEVDVGLSSAVVADVEKHIRDLRHGLVEDKANGEVRRGLRSVWW